MEGLVEINLGSVPVRKRRQRSGRPRKEEGLCVCRGHASEG